MLFAVIGSSGGKTRDEILSTLERNCIGGRIKNTSQAEMEGWPCSAQ